MRCIAARNQSVFNVTLAHIHYTITILGRVKYHNKGGHVTPCFSVTGQNYGQTSHFQISDSFNLLILSSHHSAWSHMRFQSSGSAPSELLKHTKINLLYASQILSHPSHKKEFHWNKPHNTLCPLKTNQSFIKPSKSLKTNTTLSVDKIRAQKLYNKTASMYPNVRYKVTNAE